MGTAVRSGKLFEDYYLHHPAMLGSIKIQIMDLRKLTRKIHLWVGLMSGLLVLFLGITGCILAFEQEIRNFSESYQFVQAQTANMLLPTGLKAIAEEHLEGKKVDGIEYPGNGRSAVASHYDKNSFKLVYLDPYSGTVLKVKDMKKDFFRIVLEGHFYLWLPHAVGQPILASATLIFIIMMITGLVLWWPGKGNTRKRRLSIKWQMGWRRKNYDLHNVLGFYMTWIAIFIAVTGLVMGFQWFARSVYWVSSGGRSMAAYIYTPSDTASLKVVPDLPDSLVKHHVARMEEDESLSVYFPSDKTGPLDIIVNHRPGTHYNSDAYRYDQYTGKQLPAAGSYAGKFKEASFADKIVRMNYDIHRGSILGLPGKILAFFASLIAASLPVTGFMIWWGRKDRSLVLKNDK